EQIASYIDQQMYIAWSDLMCHVVVYCCPDPPGFRDVAIAPIHANSTIPREFSATLQFKHITQLSRKFDKSLSSPTTFSLPRVEILPCGHGGDTSRVLIRCKQ